MIDLNAEWRKSIDRGKGQATASGALSNGDGLLAQIRIHLLGDRLREYDYELDIDASTGRTSGLAALLWRPGEVVRTWSSRRGRCPAGASGHLELEALFFGLSQCAEAFPGASIRVWTDCNAILYRLTSKRVRSWACSASEGLSAVQVEWVPRWCVAEADLVARTVRRGRAVVVGPPMIEVENRRRSQSAYLRRKNSPTLKEENHET